LFVHFFALLFSFNSRTGYGVLVDLGKWLFFWIKYLDVWLGRHPMSRVLSGGTYIVARKPLTPPL
jgi:hypothetical protein